MIPDGFDLAGIDDSKRLSPIKRAELAVRIRAECLYAVVSVDHLVIDEINILWASMRAMELAFEQLVNKPICVYVDGDRVPRALIGSAEAVIGGDARYACIAAASILAKTERDAMMCEMAVTYPRYGFDRHFGYATPEHLAALKEHGPCAIHRRSFAPVSQAQMSLFEPVNA
jgi:ribonuclease HII